MACIQRTRLGDVAVFENRQPVTAAKFINKSSLFIYCVGLSLRTTGLILPGGCNDQQCYNNAAEVPNFKFGLLLTLFHAPGKGPDC
jgi:hypothetical protein